MIEFDRVDRLWCEISGNPPLRVPSFALPQSIKRNGNSIAFRLQICAEASALANRKKFAQGGSVSRDFECEPSNGSGVLKPLGRGYSIDASDLESCQFVAYYLIAEGQAQDIEIVPAGSEKGRDRMSIAPGGSIICTSNLNGKKLKARVTYPETIVLTEEPIEFLYLHLVGQWGGSDRYVGVSGCEISDVTGKSIVVKLGTIDRMEILG